MLCKIIPYINIDVGASNRFAWYPTEKGFESQQDMERRITFRWLEDNLSTQDADSWIDLLKYNAHSNPSRLLSHLCSRNSAPMVHLLYPRSPNLFLNSYMYTLSPMLFSDFCQPPFTQKVLQDCLCARTAHLNAACLCALSGAVSCLEALLDLGADPDGMDGPESWSYIELLNDQILPVSPMDCALLSGEEDCQQVLELFGGSSLHGHG